MQLADRFLIDSSLPPSLRVSPPGCPRIPLPFHTNNLTPQQRFDQCNQDRSTEPDMYTVAQTASMTGLTENEVRTLIEAGRAIAVATPEGELRLPYWQFFDPLWSYLPDIRKALRSTNPWSLLIFLDEAPGCLMGMTTRTAIERGHLRHVLVYAEWGDQ